MKLCNFRDCTTGNFEPCPHNAVDPCKVYRHVETGHWYDEVTGQSITFFRREDGTMFDVKQWLETQAIAAAETWKQGHKVHEEFRSRELIQTRSRPAARAPKYSNEELDGISDAFIRNSEARADLVNEIYEAGLELHGFLRMQKKWGDHPLIAQRVQEVQEKRDALRAVQSDMDQGSSEARTHLRSENRWNDKWRPKRGSWEDFVLMCEDDERLFVIDRHGLKSDGTYLYLPDEDQKFFESALWAETRLGIARSRWMKMGIPAEKIGAPKRNYGKNNANGRRIRARADQIKYAGTVWDLIKAMRAMHVSVLKIRDDDELYAYYLKNIAPTFQRG
jgi:hypothetical protein